MTTDDVKGTSTSRLATVALPAVGPPAIHRLALGTTAAAPFQPRYAPHRLPPSGDGRAGGGAVVLVDVRCRCCSWG